MQDLHRLDSDKTTTTHRATLSIKSAAALAALISIGLASGSARAEAPSRGDVELEEKKPEKRFSVNLSPLGLLSGSYATSFEYLRGSHGLIIESSFNFFSDDDSSSSAVGSALGYRWHWRGRQNSGFLGVNLGASAGGAETSVGEGANERDVDFDVVVFSVTGNVGKRWVWDSGLNVTIRAGAGYGRYTITTEDEDPDAQEAVDDIDDLLRRFPVALDGELSIGLVF